MKNKEWIWLVGSAVFAFVICLSLVTGADFVFRQVCPVEAETETVEVNDESKTVRVPSSVTCGDTFSPGEGKGESETVCVTSSVTCGDTFSPGEGKETVIEVTTEAETSSTASGSPSPDGTAETEIPCGDDCELAYIGCFKITGYYPEEGYYEGKTCASGVGLAPGVCAMNRQRMRELGIGYGTVIEIEGVGRFTVWDCGCSYNTVDVWCRSKAEAYSLPDEGRAVYTVNS